MSVGERGREDQPVSGRAVPARATAGTTLAEVLPIPEWHAEALCAETDPDAFFPEKGESSREAKRICLGCEVKRECLEHALTNQERFGIWGGLSERERRRLVRAQSGAAA
jgi:WhiB family redox-sensing transcriptional regulator